MVFIALGSEMLLYINQFQVEYTSVIFVNTKNIRMKFLSIDQLSEILNIPFNIHFLADGDVPPDSYFSHTFSAQIYMIWHCLQN